MIENSKYVLNIAICFVINCFMAFMLNAQTINFEGVYSGKKLIIYNPVSSDYLGTCIQRIVVNGDIYPFNISDNYIEVNLSSLDIKNGDFFKMQIETQGDCSPYIYNKSDFKSDEAGIFTNLIFKDNLLTWKTSNEIINSPYILEMKYQSDWVKIAKIESHAPGSQSYTYTLPILLSGDNVFRITKSNTKVQYAYFPILRKPNQNLTLSSTISSRWIYVLKNNVPTSTYFKLVDSNGFVVSQGVSKAIDLSNYKTGFYTLYFDNQQQQILKQ